MFLGLSFRLLFCLDISTIFPHKRLCLEAKDRSKMPNEANLRGGGVQTTQEEGLGRGEEGRVRLQVQTFSQDHLKI